MNAMTTNEQAALTNLESYAEDFRLRAAAVKIACLQEENARLYRRLDRAEKKHIDESEGQSERREREADERLAIASDWNDERRMEELREAARC
jgi:hypothetical protein